MPSEPSTKAHLAVRACGLVRSQADIPAPDHAQ